MRYYVKFKGFQVDFSIFSQGRESGECHGILRDLLK